MSKELQHNWSGEILDCKLVNRTFAPGRRKLQQQLDCIPIRGGGLTPRSKARLQSTIRLTRSGAIGTTRDLLNLLLRMSSVPALRSKSPCVNRSSSPARNPTRYRTRSAVPRTVARSGEACPGGSSTQAFRKRVPSSRLSTRGTNFRRTIRKDRRSGTMTRTSPSRRNRHTSRMRVRRCERVVSDSVFLRAT